MVEYCEANCISVQVDVYANGENLLYEIKDGKRYEAYLVDVEMPGMNGLELAKKIREFEPVAYIVFITSHIQYAIEGYEVNAYRYILKSDIQEKLPRTMEKMLKDLHIEEKKYYVINTSNRYEKIMYRDILYIRRDRKNAIFVTIYGEHQKRITLRDLYKELDPDQFFFIERGYIVNIMHIAGYQQNRVILSNDDYLVVSYSHVEDTKRRLMKHWGMKLG